MRSSIITRQLQSRDSTLSSPSETSAANGELGWLAAVGAMLFLVASVGTLLSLSLGAFVTVYAVIVALISWAYVRSAELDLLARFANNPDGTFSATIVAASLGLVAVLGEPVAGRGSFEISSLLWSVVHGSADAIALSVLPILVVSRVTRSDLLLRLGSGGAAIAASALAVIVYHAGFANAWSARGFLVAGIVVAITTCGVVARNPLPAIVGHVVMHAALALVGASEGLLRPH
ncbi:MAG: hypothetical protein ACXVEE_00585 [Polyangiales bacterium]